LSARFGARLSTARSTREQHRGEESNHPPALPDAVFFASSIADIQAALRICNKWKCPVIPFGAGSSLEGHLAAVQGGLSLNLGKMNKILRINAADMDCVVEAGVTRKALEQALRDTGLFFPIDPGANATIGGMAATRASGTTTVRYGPTRQSVLSMKVVMPDGRLIETGRRARKSSAGYDLTGLMIESEGALGVIAEIALRLQGTPEKIVAANLPVHKSDGGDRRRHSSGTIGPVTDPDRAFGRCPDRRGQRL
jgi:D-lactate dehydrogenase (cytochrome)